MFVRIYIFVTQAKIRFIYLILWLPYFGYFMNFCLLCLFLNLYIFHKWVNIHNLRISKYVYWSKILLSSIVFLFRYYFSLQWTTPNNARKERNIHFSNDFLNLIDGLSLHLQPFWYKNISPNSRHKFQVPRFTTSVHLATGSRRFLSWRESLKRK